MSEYMTQDHPDAFLDFPSVEETRKELIKKGRYNPDNHKDCPVCKGYGGWNLKINRYVNRKEDTPQNRHLYSHFRCSCSHCNGWGFVDKKEECPDHEWKITKQLGNCSNEYTCQICGKKRIIDSSG